MYRLVHGGEGGIRTLGTGCPVQLFSRQSSSTTPAPLQKNVLDYTAIMVFVVYERTVANLAATPASL
jgi:hypothetical protein